MVLVRFLGGGKKGRTEQNFSAAACLQGRASIQAKSSATALKSASEQGLEPPVPPRPLSPPQHHSTEVP